MRGGEGPGWRAVADWFVETAELAGRRVLDVGCGTGRLAAALAERHGAKVWGVDASPEMLAVARRRVPAGVGLKHGRAEDLPFRDGWFERVTMTLVYHHVDPRRALAEARRVLTEGGRLALLTFHPEEIGDHYLNRYFPSMLAIDLERFASPERLERELTSAGLGPVTFSERRQTQSLTRAEALERIRGKHISTFQLIPDEEYDRGLASAERELPERIEYAFRWLAVVATRS